MRLPSSLTLTASGFAQVFLIAMNTVFLAKAFTGGALVAGFLISYIWSHNVRRVAFGTEKDRWAYSVGAALGSVAGLWAAGILVEFLT